MPLAGIAQDTAGVPLRLAVAEAASGKPTGKRPSLERAIRVLSSQGTRILSETTSGDNADADVLLLSDDCAPEIDGWSTERIRTVAEGILRGGRGLVVVGRAASALAESAEYSALLGRKTAADMEEEPGESEGLRLAIVDQRHPITACLTHTLLDGTRFTATGMEAVDALGVTLVTRRGREAGLGKPVSVAWTRRHGRGRVVVLAVSPLREPDVNVTRLLDALTARAMLHAAGHRVSVPLPADLPLASERVEASEAGVLEGFPVLEGYYRGRRIAPVMSHRGADWLTRSDREETEKPELVLDALDIPEGATVADLGAGNGYFTLRVAGRVGPEGRVLAVDIQKEMLEKLRRRSREQGHSNIDLVLATEKDPGLPEKSVDLVLLVDVYHELSHPREVMEKVRKSLTQKIDERPAGRLVLVEYRGEDPSVPILALHRITLDQIRAELEALGFEWKTTHEFLPYQRVLEFTAGG
jgi:predicted methyltransferase